MLRHFCMSNKKPLIEIIQLEVWVHKLFINPKEITKSISDSLNTGFV